MTNLAKFVQYLPRQRALATVNVPHNDDIEIGLLLFTRLNRLVLELVLDFRVGFIQRLLVQNDYLWYVLAFFELLVALLLKSIGMM